MQVLREQFEPVVQQIDWLCNRIPPYEPTLEERMSNTGDTLWVMRYPTQYSRNDVMWFTMTL